MSGYEWDHLMPLCAGGSPDSPLNMWLEPRFDPNGWTADRKDDLEREVCHMICSGQITLRQGQAAFTDDWTIAYEHYVKGD